MFAMLSEYVKVCSLYGAGFYYVPGTDICLKIGAYFRAEYAVGNIGASLTNLDATGADGQRTRLIGPDYQQRARAFVFLDSRQQTAYGTLRAYFNIGHSSDFPQQVGTSAAGGLRQPRVHPARWIHVGPRDVVLRLLLVPGDLVLGSVVERHRRRRLEGGCLHRCSSATACRPLSRSKSRAVRLWSTRRWPQARAGTFQANSAIPENRSNNPFVLGALPVQDMGAVKWPDVVANLRIDQAWGSAQIMGAIHNVGGGYYGASLTNVSQNGHPADEIGFAVGAGIKINFPMIGPGDYFQAQVNYTEGAVRYAALTPSGAGSPGIFGNAAPTVQSVGVGFFTEAVYCGATTVTAGAGCPAVGGSSLQPDDHLERSGGLRALLDAKPADVAGRRLHRHQLQRGGQCADVRDDYSHRHSSHGASGCQPARFRDDCRRHVRRQLRRRSTGVRLELLQHVFAHPVEHHEGLLRRSGRLLWPSEHDGEGPDVLFTGRSLTSVKPTAFARFDDQDVFVYRMRVHRDLVP